MIFNNLIRSSSKKTNYFSNPVTDYQRFVNAYDYFLRKKKGETSKSNIGNLAIDQWKNKVKGLDTLKRDDIINSLLKLKLPDILNDNKEVNNTENSLEIDISNDKDKDNDNNDTNEDKSNKSEANSPNIFDEYNKDSLDFDVFDKTHHNDSINIKKKRNYTDLDTLNFKFQITNPKNSKLNRIDIPLQIYHTKGVKRYNIKRFVDENKNSDETYEFESLHTFKSDWNLPDVPSLELQLITESDFYMIYGFTTHEFNFKIRESGFINYSIKDRLSYICNKYKVDKNLVFPLYKTCVDIDQKIKNLNKLKQNLFLEKNQNNKKNNKINKNDNENIIDNDYDVPIYTVQRIEESNSSEESDDDNDNDDDNNNKTIKKSNRKGKKSYGRIIPVSMIPFILTYCFPRKSGIVNNIAAYCEKLVYDISISNICTRYRSVINQNNQLDINWKHIAYRNQLTSVSGPSVLEEINRHRIEMAKTKKEIEDYLKEIKLCLKELQGKKKQ